MENQSSESVFDLQFDQQCKSYLLETAKWNKFMSIVWFVLCGLFLILAIFMGAIMSSLYGDISSVPGMEQNMGMMSMFGAGMGMFMSVLYILLTAVYLIPNFWRYKFSVQAIRAVQSNDQAQLNSSLNNLRKYSKYWGIFTIILIAFYVIMFVFGLIGGAMMGR